MKIGGKLIDISIIVPIYNVEKYLRECIDGLLEQTFKNYELILINDGSTDDSANICNKYKKIDSRIKVIHQRNQGVSAARNAGLDSATGKYIYFCDADDYMSMDLLKENFESAEKYEANMVIFGYNSVENNSIIQTHNVANSAFYEAKYDFRNHYIELHQNYLTYTLWNKLYKRDYIVENQINFDGELRIGEDAVFNYNLYENIDRVYINSNCYYNYRMFRENSALNIESYDNYHMRVKEVTKLEELFIKWGLNKERENLILLEKYQNINIYYYKIFANKKLKKFKSKLRVMQQILKEEPNKKALNYIYNNKSIESNRLKILVFRSNSKFSLIMIFLIKNLVDSINKR